MRIGLTFDLQLDPTDTRQAEFDPPQTIDALAGALQALGHEVVRLGSAQDLLAVGRRLTGSDLIFNIAEGAWGRCREGWAPTILDLLGVPYVGSDALGLALGLDKAMCKQLAVVSGIRTPRWIVVDERRGLPNSLPLSFPLIVKPRYEGSGIGIDRQAVVWDQAALRRRIEWLSCRLRAPVIVEEFIPFGELTVFLIGNEPPTALPVVQRPLDPMSRLSCHLVDRGGEGRTEWLCPVELTPALEAEAGAIAIAMFRALHCRDMARVDLRVSEAGAPFFLEINPLPSFDPEGSVALIAEHLGITYTDLVGRVLDAALRRLQRSARACTPP